VLHSAGLPCESEYAEAEVLDAVRRFATETDPPWRIRRYREWRAETLPLPPAEGAIIRRFGGWRQGLAKAGFPQPSRTHEQFVLNALDRFVNETSPPWTITKYRRWRLRTAPLPPTDASIIRGTGVAGWRDAVARVDHP
jgi:hypothetical protein